MLLSVDVKETVAQLHVQQGAGYALIGHAFYLNLLDGDQVFSYLVASKHVVDTPARQGQTIFISASRRDAPLSESVRLSAPWVYPADPAVDLAVAPRLDGNFPAGAAALSADWIVTQARLAGRLVEGLEVLFVSRVIQNAGPIYSPALVRQGHLALAPAQVLAGPCGPSSYLLVECAAQPSDSGAPLFMAAQAPAGQPALALLGVVTAAHSAGLALVTPAEQILDILQQDDLARLRHAGVGAGRLRQAASRLRDS